MRNEYEIEHCMRCINNALPDVAIGCGVKFTYPPSSLPLVIISAFVPTVSNFQLPRPDSFAMENLPRGSLYFCIPARTRAAIPRSTQSHRLPARPSINTNRLVATSARLSSAANRAFQVVGPRIWNDLLADD